MSFFAPPICDSEAHAAFDFWVGEWDVYPNGPGDLVARSRIERLYNGCAIRENWLPLNGRDGGSLNSLDPASGLWHQTWVDSRGGLHEYRGSRQGANMVFFGSMPVPSRIAFERTGPIP